MVCNGRFKGYARGPENEIPLMKNTLRLFVTGIAVFTFLLAFARFGFAAEVATHLDLKPDVKPEIFELIIKDHRFEPSQFMLQPSKRYILRVINKDASAEEFESRYLKRKRVIPGNSSTDIAIGPLKPGVYDFIGQYHQDTAQGRITVPQFGTPYPTNN
jgi:hypothetical protein